MSYTAGDLVDGKFRILRLIGDGGMGSVYEARHEYLGVPVALKFLHADLAKRPGLSARFLQEARVSATIQSAHVAHVTDVDTASDGAPYLVMELLQGESLQTLLNRRSKLAVAQAVDFGLQILSGLEAAHALGVVHRDLKPDNVFVTPSSGGPLLKLIDFGIAKLKESSEYKKELTRAGVVMGTPEYMAPEQFYAARDVDHRADLYSLGVMLFEMLSGARPTDGDTPEAIVGAVMSGNVRRLASLDPSLPSALVALVERALVADRDRRFASAYEMRAALAQFAGELSAAGKIAAVVEPSGAPLTPPHVGGAAGAPAIAGQNPVTATLDGAPAPDALARTLPPDEVGVGAARTPATQAAPPPALNQPWPALGAPPPQPARRKRRSTLPWVFAGLGLVALSAGVVIVISLSSSQRRIVDSLPQLPAEPAATDSSNPISIEPLARPPAAAAVEQSPTPHAAPRPPVEPHLPTPTTPSPQPDAGTAPNGTISLPFPQLALPSTLPPLPSGLPTAFPTALPTALPSFLPQIPGLTLPGTPAPQASAR